MTIRLLVVEDHPVFASGLVALLSAEPDLDVVDAVSDAPAALEALAASPVDVVLMDLNLPRTSGVAATASVVGLPDAPRVLVVTMVDDDDTVVAALGAGARGYVLKGAGGAEIVAAVRTVAGGGAVFGAGVATQVLAMASSPAGQRDRNGLTDREWEVLELIARGDSNVAIARSLGLTVKTVQNYVSRILDKLAVSDRTQAALRAREHLLP